MLHEQLEAEQSTRGTRERSQAQLGKRLQAEARTQQAGVLKSLRERLDHMARVNYDVPFVR